MIKVVCSKCDGSTRMNGNYGCSYDTYECDKCEGYGYYYVDLRYEDSEIVIESE